MNIVRISIQWQLQSHSSDPLAGPHVIRAVQEARGYGLVRPAAAFPPAFSHLRMASLVLSETSWAVVDLPKASTNCPRGSIR